MPKTEATNRRLISKCTAHIGSRKILLDVKQVILGYCCQWLLCIQGWLIQGKRSYHVCLPQVVGHKRKPQFDGKHKVRNLHIQGGENLSHFQTYDHCIQFTSQQLVTGTTGTHPSKFIWICYHLCVDFPVVFIRFGTIFIWICCHLHLDL